MLKNFTFVLLGIFIVLIIAGILAAFGWLSLEPARAIIPAPIPPVASGYIKNISFNNAMVNMTIAPVDNPSGIFNQNCQTAPNGTDQICQASQNVEIDTQLLSKNLDFTSPASLYRSIVNIYPHVLFQFNFTAGQISKIAEKTS
ncbi:hypothetical protein M1403_03615 [Patescibacteria group bacterium]|nr:hypothetical protein [Patescibacteria group bacterium]